MSVPFQLDAFTVHEVQFANGTTGRGVFAVRDIGPCVLPYVGKIKQRSASNYTHGVLATYLSRKGKQKSVRDLVLDGDPSVLLHEVDFEFCYASLVNEPESGQQPNCVLHVNPLLHKSHIEAAFETGDPLIGSFVVTAPLLKGQQLLMQYGSAYSREYKTWQPSTDQQQAYREMIDVSYQTLSAFTETHSTLDLPNK
jgi:hypothetical protein